VAGQRPAFPHIGWDPTPGNVEDTRDLAKQIGKLAGELGTALSELERIECGAWKGKTAIAFTDYIGQDVTPLIRKSHDSFDKASRALHHWANQLDGFQERADRLEKEAGEKLSAKADAQAKADQKGDGKGSDELGKASSAVDGVIQRVHDLEEEYRQAARKISKELDKAGDIAPDEPGFWDKLGSGIANAWDATGDWLQDHANLIKAIGDVLSDITALMGVLAIVTLPFPPLAAIFGTAALIGAGLTLATHGIAKAAGADVGWAQLGLDAVGLLPGIGMFGKGAKIVGASKAALTATRLGKGFEATKIAGGSRIIMSFGKESADIVGGFGKAGLVKIGGWSDEAYQVAHSGSGLMSRMGGLSVAGYHQGQLIGSKGANLIPGVNINPFGAGGIALDAGLKIAPKIYGHLAGD
jgi:hypothetical protein